MQHLKNIFVGFLVSYIGSLPLGYLNIVGYEVFQQLGWNSTILYLLGVVSIEIFVIYFTLLFARQLMNNHKLMRFIEGFSVIFMFVLAYVFYSSATKEAQDESIIVRYIDYSPYFLGLLLSGLNFIQLPFWTGWNLYLLNGNHIEISHSRKYFYLIGTLIGTFLGMLTLILSLHYLANQNDFLSQYLMRALIPLVFVGLGCFQAYSFYQKYKQR